MDNQEKVAAFMRLAQQEVKTKPDLPDAAVQHLRWKLIIEEAVEFSDAVAAQDLVAIADAIGDLLYVVYGAAVAFGIPAQAIFDEVHRSNMSKFIDGHRREDGKWVKGASYSPPDLEAVLEAH
jgi:predicted HAD superfamily Cof-like phosphohydrolase